VNWVLSQAHVRLGDPYVYGGFYSPTDTSQGADCSGVVGWVLEALVNTPANMDWQHDVSTESWFYDYNDNCPAAPGTVGPYGTIAVANLSDIPADAALTVNIMHGGGGEDSHTNCCVPLPGSAPYEGVLVESNGGHDGFPGGSCTNGTGAYPSDASLWTDHWYLPGPWVMDVPPADPNTSPPAPVGKTYTVQSGDTLDSIADQFGLSATQLLAANPQIGNPNLIYPGQVFNIP
jgi:LysM domain